MKANNPFTSCIAILLGVCLLLQACTTIGGQRDGAKDDSNLKTQAKASFVDGPPLKDIDVTHLPDATPKVEPIHKEGNTSPYTIMGKTYTLLPTRVGYRERGVASWYGNKFHGGRTANGETYSMYAMTAAHKTLPIPCYVKVTNLDNQHTVIVRVNDRGPFHDNRIIDLSYAAAKKLGFSKNGTAKVEVVSLDPWSYQKNIQNTSVVAAPLSKVDTASQQLITSAEKKPISTVIAPKATESKTTAPKRVEPKRVEPKRVVGQSPVIATVKEKKPTPRQNQLPENTYLQIGAFSKKARASHLSERVKKWSSYRALVLEEKKSKHLFKVLIGPIKDRSKLIELKKSLRQKENLSGFLVYR